MGISKSVQSQKMNIVIVGHVDHGKSTVVGRLLADTGSLPNGKLEQVQDLCRKNSKPFEYAFLLDALKDEQSQGITIDSARCFFKSKKREYIIIDAPGHIEFLKNMISGAARAEAALLIIDAKEGIQENSKRHGYLLSMLGIRQIAVCVNKMDLVQYDEKVFQNIEREYRKFLSKIGIEPRFFVPIAAREGVNMTEKSHHMPWYQGESILDVLDAFDKAPPLDQKPFRMPVQGVYKFTNFNDERRIVAGRVESGRISAGDAVIFLPSHKRSEVKSIEGFNLSDLSSVSAGYSTGFTLKEQIYVNRGEIMCKASDPQPLVSTLVRVQLFWMGRTPLVFGKEYKLKLGTAKVPMHLKEIKKVMDASDLKREEKQQIDRHEVAECVFECHYPIAFDTAHDLEATGRFVVVDEYDIAGGGIISAMVKDEQADLRQEITIREEKWDFSIIDPKERAAAYAHNPKLILLTGKVGVDKKTIAKHVEKKLFERGCKTYFLGIGNILRGLAREVEKNRKNRRDPVRKLGEVAHMFVDAGALVLATASDLNDEELSLLQEVMSRESMLVVHVGANEFRHGTVDLELKAEHSLEVNVCMVLKLLEDSGIFAL